MDVKITGELCGITVKEYLYKNGFSGGYITKLKKLPDGITVNGEHVTVRRVLLSGDVLHLSSEDRFEDENEFLVPTEMPLDIIYEDDDMIALNKPPNLATHPSIGHFDDTLANGLAYYFKDRSEPFVFRAVNRLDRETSGVVLIAKNRLASSKLCRAMREGGIRKEYTAILNGRLTPETGTVNTYIRRSGEGIILRTVCSASDIGAKEAVTAYKTLYMTDTASVVSAEPITGRTHQLRVHFSHLGAPIIGDPFYGSAETSPTDLDKLISRQALHASVLKVKIDDKEMCFRAELPNDMAKLLEYIKA